jgi:ubiquinone/menaquinone biosynthesis C-methylase UbiE
MYNPKEYWRNELGGIEAWKQNASSSTGILKSIDRVKTVVIPKIKELKKSIGGNILDAGCGSGYCVNEFKKSGLWTNSFGIDFQEHRIDFCKDNFFGIDFRVGSLTDLPYEDKFFDVIYTGAVLMHLPVADKIKAIAEFCRVLADDGFYFGHEVIVKTNEEIVSGAEHVINPNIEWLRKQFSPFNVDEIILHYDDYNFQIIYAHK